MNHEDENTPSLPASQHIAAEDLMLYALELLSPEEAQIVQNHLHGSAGEGGGCAQCQADLAEVRAGLGLYAIASAPVAEPPASSRARLLAGVRPALRSAESVLPNAEATLPATEATLPHARASLPDFSAGSPAAGSALPGASSTLPSAGSAPGPQAPGNLREASPAPLPFPADRQTAPPAPAAPTPLLVKAGRSNAGGWWGWAIAAMLALVALHFFEQRQSLKATLATQGAQVTRLAAEQAQARAIVGALTDPVAQRVSLTLTRGGLPPQPSGRATYLPQKGTLIFLASHLQPLAPGKTYELWVIPASGAAPVAAGTFKPDAGGNASVVTAQLEPGIAAKAFGVTVEPDGGAASPTMPILLAGS